MMQVCAERLSIQFGHKSELKEEVETKQYEFV